MPTLFYKLISSDKTMAEFSSRLSFPPSTPEELSNALFSISIEIAIRLLTVTALSCRGNAHNERESKRGGQI